MSDERWFESTGTLHYDKSPDGGYRLVLNIDKGISLFYRSLIPKYYKANPQRYEPHISVIRKEKPKNLAAWGKYEGKRIKFIYSNYIHNGTQYWWLDCYSKELEAIREELGLSIAPPHPSLGYHKPKDGYSKVFHTTIANFKAV